LLGDASVGKSSLSVRYFHDEFPESYNITFGGVFFKKSIDISKDLTASLQIWDTGGEEKYRSMAPLYYRNANIAFLVCSLTDNNPTSSLQYWLDELSEKV
jgi:small GTP-binding protein